MLPDYDKEARSAGSATRWQTETDRVHRHLKEDLTRTERLRNWWWYHRFHLLIALLVLLLLGYFAWQDAGVDDQDYHVAWVGITQLPLQEADALAQRLAAFGEDENGDGQVVVQIHQYCIDLSSNGEGQSGQEVLAAYNGLETDFSVYQSGIFLLEDPESFQSTYGALCRLDGTLPEDGESVESLVVAWEDIPALGELPVDCACSLGFRGVWDDSGAGEARLEDDWALWCSILGSME
ncbi:MAG: hypothetical protein LUF86_00065 [Clostridiales bacterium]|nr:hypothetical protein [Clostridiales bacterium]